MMEQAYEIPEDTKEQYLTQYEQFNHFFRELQSFQCETSPCISGQTISRRIQTEDICFYKIIKLSYDEDCPQREAFENVLLLLDDSNYNFVYILSGEQSDVSLYIGVVNNSTNRNASNASDYGRMLQDAMEGNFSGSKLEKVKGAQLEQLIGTCYHSAGAIVGIPSRNETDGSYDFQGTDRLINSMAGLKRKWRLVISCEPVQKRDVLQLQNDTFNLYNRLSIASKASVQGSKSHGVGVTFGQSSTTTNQKGRSTHEDRSNSSSDTSRRTSGKTTSSSRGYGQSISKSVASGNSHSRNSNDGISQSISFELANKHAADLMKYIDEELLSRLRSGLTRGLFKTSVYYMADTPAAAKKLGEIVTTLFQGKSSSFSPLLANQFDLGYGKEYCCNFLAHELPGQTVSEDAALLYGHPTVHNGHLMMSSYLTSKEVCLFAGLPRKEVPGISLSKGVEFGLNQNQVSKDGIELGPVIQRGRELVGNTFSIPKSSLTKHIFIGGVTGSGKTTTCHKLLSEAQLPFLVIEPAKTEYRVLLEQIPELTVFTLGDEQTAPFRLNPFELLPGENISAHVDMLKATFTSAFPMEASMPQILEEAIYRCYEKKGWNLSTNENSRGSDPDDHFFPILSDLLIEMKSVIEDKHFGAELKGNYIGSLVSRLSNLTVGSKGSMLNCRRSIDFNYLIEHPVIIEMDELKSSEDKALFMGFILARLATAIQQKYKETHGHFRHLTLIEEAHRLLSRVEFGDSGAKKSAVETFTDLLAEVRKYGEGFIVVDQIPNKLAPEVLKNTNTKIIHKIFARDDKEAVGDTMLMDDKQKEFLSSLEPGQAIIFSENTPKPIHVQIVRSTDTSENTPDNTVVQQRFASRHKQFGSCYKDYRMKQYIEGALTQYLEFMNHLVRRNDNAKTEYRDLIRTIHKANNDFKPSGGIQSVWSTLITLGECKSGAASANPGQEQEREENLLRLLSRKEFPTEDRIAEYSPFLSPYKTK